jgi:hypothetical protein
MKAGKTAYHGFLFRGNLGPAAGNIWFGFCTTADWPNAKVTFTAVGALYKIIILD